MVNSLPNSARSAHTMYRAMDSDQSALNASNLAHRQTAVNDTITIYKTKPTCKAYLTCRTAAWAGFDAAAHIG